MQHRPPTSKDVLEALMASAQVPLTDSSCRDAGTVGRYLSGYLAELSNPDAKNAIETTIESRSPIWLCRVMIRHAQGEDIWRWGLAFTISQTDGTVDPTSFRCLGAG